MNDPVEQAKHWLRCKGYSPVYTDKGQHYVGRRVLADSAALFEFAARKGWGRATPQEERAMVKWTTKATAVYTEIS